VNAPAFLPLIDADRFTVPRPQHIRGERVHALLCHLRTCHVVRKREREKSGPLQAPATHSIGDIDLESVSRSGRSRGDSPGRLD
jgi:hypothetical protein